MENLSSKYVEITVSRKLEPLVLPFQPLTLLSVSQGIKPQRLGRLLQPPLMVVP